MHTHTHAICTLMRTYIIRLVNMYTHTQMHTRTRTRTHAHARTHKHTHAHTQTQTQTQTQTHTHIHTCTQTHTNLENRLGGGGFNTRRVCGEYTVEMHKRKSEEEALQYTESLG